MVATNHNLIYAFAHDNNLNLDDWYGLLALELCRTIPKYNPNRGALSTYYYIRCESLLRLEYKKSQAQMRSHNGILELDEELVADESVDDVDEKLVLEELLKWGNEDIIMLRYKGYTQSEIAEQLGVSQPQISKILNDTLELYNESRGDRVD